MGTRNLTMIKLDGALKLANYGQWDGYPEGQGATVAAFVQAYLLHDVTRGEFADSVRKLAFATPEQLAEIDAAWSAQEKADREAHKAGNYVSKRSQERFVAFNRDTGATILQKIWDGLECQIVKDESEFLKDGLFCEWAYCVNLDTCKVDVYMGGTRPATSIKFADFTVFAMRGLRKRLERNHAAKMARVKAKGGKVVSRIEAQMVALVGGGK